VIGTWHIRAATDADLPRLADLAGQLGYAAEVDEVRERLPGILGDPAAGLLVASDDAGRAIGWLHVELKQSLLSALAAQIMGLVVDEAWRSSGVGSELVARAEAWAAERGCREMLVATRISRERAHGFYRREGYELIKTSYIFSKRLGDGG
jgi:GNAT superfamily N-acetyltransferase